MVPLALEAVVPSALEAVVPLGLETVVPDLDLEDFLPNLLPSAAKGIKLFTYNRLQECQCHASKEELTLYIENTR